MDTLVAFIPASELNERPSEKVELSGSNLEEKEEVPELGSFTVAEQTVNKCLKRLAWCCPKSRAMWWSLGQKPKLQVL